MIEAARRIRPFLIIVALLLWRQICLVRGRGFADAYQAEVALDDTRERPRVYFGQTLPDVPLVTLDGRKTSMRRSITRASLIVFADVHCAVCQEELQEIEENVPAINKLVNIVAIESGRSLFYRPIPSAQRLSKSLGLQYPVLVDPERRTTDTILPFNPRYPTIMLVDSHCRLVWIQSSHRQGDGGDWPGVISQFIKTSPPRKKTRPFADVMLTDVANRSVSLRRLSFHHPVLITLASGPGKCGACDRRLRLLAYLDKSPNLRQIVAFSTSNDARQWQQFSHAAMGVSLDRFSAPEWCHPLTVPVTLLMWRGQVLIDEPKYHDDVRLIGQIIQTLPSLHERSAI